MLASSSSQHLESEFPLLGNPLSIPISGSMLAGKTESDCRRWPGDQPGKPAQVLGNGGQRELVLCAARTAKPKAVQLENAFEMGEQHLDPFAIAARSLEGFSAGQRTGNIASALVDAAWDFALGCLRAAPRLERARATIGGPCTIQKCLAIMDPACRAQQFALRADIDIAVGVEDEVLSAQLAVVAPGLVHDGNVRSNLSCRR